MFQGKLYTNKETSVIKRLQAHNIIACTFKTVDKTVNKSNFNLIYLFLIIFQTIFYLACTTRDNILILSEFTLVSSDFLYGKIKYKSENQCRESDFENYLTLILSSCGEQDSAEETIAR